MNWVTIGSAIGLLPDRHQAIARTNTDLLAVGALGTNFSDIWINIQ